MQAFRLQEIQSRQSSSTPQEVVEVILQKGKTINTVTPPNTKRMLKQIRDDITATPAPKNKRAPMKRRRIVEEDDDDHDRLQVSYDETSDVEDDDRETIEQQQQQEIIFHRYEYYEAIRRKLGMFIERDWDSEPEDWDKDIEMERNAKPELEDWDLN